jgi:hypothetical protein
MVKSLSMRASFFILVFMLSSCSREPFTKITTARTFFEHRNSLEPYLKNLSQQTTHEILNILENSRTTIFCPQDTPKYFIQIELNRKQSGLLIYEDYYQYLPHPKTLDPSHTVRHQGILKHFDTILIQSGILLN